VMRANLWLRTPSRVLVRVARFPATAFYELEKRAKKVEWERFLAAGAAAEFRVTARKSKLYHSDAIAERLLKVVRSHGRSSSTRKPSVAPPQTGHSQLFVVRVVRDVVEVSADTSGDLLHMRGYRQAVAKAPLRETLAAALLLATGWNGGEALLDPFCGSGTIPIEGALIARGLPPGFGRSYSFERWKEFDATVWQALRRDASRGASASAPVSLWGSDRDAGAVQSASENAERAGVASDVTFEQKALSAVEPATEVGLVATNPPYGKRVGARTDVRDLYAQFGKVLRAKCRGWRIALYCPDERLVKQTGLPLETLFATSNGGIRVLALGGQVP